MTRRPSYVYPKRQLALPPSPEVTNEMIFGVLLSIAPVLERTAKTLERLIPAEQLDAGSTSRSAP